MTKQELAEFVARSVGEADDIESAEVVSEEVGVVYVATNAGSEFFLEINDA